MLFSEEIRRMRLQAEALRRVSVSVESPGEYPVKRRTPVSDVCRYQNDGTDRGITPSKFIERAEASANEWESEISKGIDEFLEGLDTGPLKAAADIIAKDISNMCDRVDTGRMKRSFEGKIETDGRD